MIGVWIHEKMNVETGALYWEAYVPAHDIHRGLDEEIYIYSTSRDELFRKLRKELLVAGLPKGDIYINPTFPGWIA